MKTLKYYVCIIENGTNMANLAIPKVLELNKITPSSLKACMYTSEENVEKRLKELKEIVDAGVWADPWDRIAKRILKGHIEIKQIEISI